MNGEALEVGGATGRARAVRADRVLAFGTLAVGLIAAMAYLTILATGNLDEDAYILFTYSTQLADGHGIVWDLAHGHAEGATDFLWMVLIAGLRVLGLDVGAAAALLNAAGAATCYACIARIADLESVTERIALGLALLLSHVMAASLGGFSAFFYCGAFTFAVSCAIRRSYPALAAALLVLGLVRPDGVILAGGVLSAVIATDRRGVLRHAMAFALAAATGVGYFLWRWAYFGLLLPLPLIVKSHAVSLLHGLRWDLLALLPLTGLLLLVAWRARALGSRLVIAALGPLLLLAALANANQLQNLAFRFQAPVTVAVLLLAFCAGRRRPLLLCVALLPSLAFGVRALAHETRLLTLPEYVNVLPQLLDPLLGPQTRVAMTEAGRLGFRLHTSKLDIVGLNSRATVEPAWRLSALVDYAPDLVFVHQVWTLDTRSLDDHADWLALTPAQYLRLPVLDDPRNAYHDDPPHAAAMAARGLIEATADRYVIYAVRYRGDFSHFFFVRRDGPLPAGEFEAVLKRALAPGSVRPHCAWSSDLPCPWLGNRT